jgi:hypothetical protein
MKPFIRIPYGDPVSFPITGYSDCQKYVPLKSAVVHRKALRADVKSAPTQLVIVTQSVQNYDNCYSKITD